MKAYRVRYKDTGLYYQPVRGSYREKTNLGKNGKVYIAKKPVFSDFSQITVNKKLIEKYSLKVSYSNIIETKESDWEIIEYILVPTEEYDNFTKTIEIIKQIEKSTIKTQNEIL